MAKDYFQSDEFKKLLSYYERQREAISSSVYLDAEDFADIADYYLSNDRPEAAMEAVNNGLSVHVGSDILLIMKSSIYIFQYQFKEAEAILAEFDDDDPEVLYQLAQLQYAYYYDTQKAEEMWHRWLQMEKENEEGDSMRENYMHIISTIAVLRDPDGSAGNRPKVAKILKRWVREYIDMFKPIGNYEYDIQLIDICRENELPDLMVEMLTQVLEEQPYFPKGWSTLALAHYVQMEYEQALEACAFALAINPKDVDALLTKAYALYDMGDRKGALPAMEEYLSNGGEWVQMLPFAEMLFKDGEAEKAKEQLEAFSYFLYEKENNLKRQMECKTLPSEVEVASQEYELFMDLYRKLTKDMGDLYYSNRCYEESLKACYSLIKNGGRTSDVYFLCGLNYLAMDKLVESLQAFKEALSVSDDKVTTGIDIALTYSVNNYDKQALEVLRFVEIRAMRENSPHAKNISVAKSLAYLKLGDIKEFLYYFRIACKDTPELIKHVYGDYFPEGVPVSDWYSYAKREIKTLLKKIRKEDVQIQ